MEGDSVLDEILDVGLGDVSPTTADYLKAAFAAIPGAITAIGGAVAGNNPAVAAAQTAEKQRSVAEQAQAIVDQAKAAAANAYNRVDTASGGLAKYLPYALGGVALLFVVKKFGKK